MLWTVPSLDVTNKEKRQQEQTGLHPCRQGEWKMNHNGGSAGSGVRRVGQGSGDNSPGSPSFLPLQSMASPVESRASSLQPPGLPEASGSGMTCRVYALSRAEPGQGHCLATLGASVCLSIWGQLGEGLREGSFKKSCMGQGLCGQTAAAWLPLQFPILHHPPEPPHSAFLPFLSHTLACRTSGTGPGASGEICVVCGGWEDFS